MKKYVKNSIWIVAGGKMKFFKKNFLLILICFLSFTLSVNAATNPYGKYQDLYGNWQELKATGMLAICIQHEMEQMDGITILNHKK